MELSTPALSTMYPVVSVRPAGTSFHATNPPPPASRNSSILSRSPFPNGAVGPQSVKEKASPVTHCQSWAAREDDLAPSHIPPHTLPTRLLNKHVSTKKGNPPAVNRLSINAFSVALVIVARCQSPDSAFAALLASVHVTPGRRNSSYRCPLSGF